MRSFVLIFSFFMSSLAFAGERMVYEADGQFSDLYRAEWGHYRYSKKKGLADLIVRGNWSDFFWDDSWPQYQDDYQGALKDHRLIIEHRV